MDANSKDQTGKVQDDYEEWRSEMLRDPEIRAEYNKEWAQLTVLYEGEERKEKERSIEKRPAAVHRDARISQTSRVGVSHSAASGRYVTSDHSAKSAAGSALSQTGKRSKGTSKSSTGKRHSEAKTDDEPKSGRKSRD